MGDKQLTFDDHIEVLTNGFRDWNGDISNLPQVRKVTAALRDAWEVRERAEAALTETTAAYLRQQKQGLTREAAVRLTLLEGKVAVLRRILGRGEEE